MPGPPGTSPGSAIGDNLFLDKENIFHVLFVSAFTTMIIGRSSRFLLSIMGI